MFGLLPKNVSFVPVAIEKLKRGPETDTSALTLNTPHVWEYTSPAVVGLHRTGRVWAPDSEVGCGSGGLQPQAAFLAVATGDVNKTAQLRGTVILAVVDRQCSAGIGTGIPAVADTGALGR